MKGDIKTDGGILLAGFAKKLLQRRPLVLDYYDYWWDCLEIRILVYLKYKFKNSIILYLTTKVRGTL